MILFAVSGCLILYRCLVVSQPWFRRMKLQTLIRTTIKVTALHQIEKRYTGLGDWFLLCQIGKNSTPYYFRAFLREVARNKNDESGENNTQPLLQCNDNVHTATMYPALQCNESTTDDLNRMESGGNFETLEMQQKFN